MAFHKGEPMNKKTQIKTSLPLDGYVRLTQLLEVIPISRASVWRKVRSGSFPAPFKLSQRITAWRVEDVRKWMAGLQVGDA